MHEINPTITVEKIERTIPSYARANPYRAGILDGERMEVEEIVDLPEIVYEYAYFLSLSIVN